VSLFAVICQGEVDQGAVHHNLPPTGPSWVHATMAATRRRWSIGRRRIRVADVKEILVRWDAGVSISGVAHSPGYSRPTVRKYVQAGQHLGLVRGSRRID
jgi:hypothetical protein